MEGPTASQVNSYAKPYYIVDNEEIEAVCKIHSLTIKVLVDIYKC